MIRVTYTIDLPELWGADAAFAEGGEDAVIELVFEDPIEFLTGGAWDVVHRFKPEQPRRRTGVFQPKNVTTLRSVLLPLIGKSFEWCYAGMSGSDEPFSGQMRWTISGKHDAELSTDQIGWWVPEQDIEFEPLAPGKE